MIFPLVTFSLSVQQLEWGYVGKWSVCLNRNRCTGLSSICEFNQLFYLNLECRTDYPPDTTGSVLWWFPEEIQRCKEATRGLPTSWSPCGKHLKCSISFWKLDTLDAFHIMWQDAGRPCPASLSLRTSSRCNQKTPPVASGEYRTTCSMDPVIHGFWHPDRWELNSCRC